MAALFVAGCSSHDDGKAAGSEDNIAKMLMIEAVQPNADTYWQAVQYISDENGSREIIPQTDAEWETVAAAARKLGQLGEDMQKPEYAEGRGADWTAYAQGLVAVSQQAEEAAAAQDPEKVLDVGGTLYNVCSACHETYMTNPAGMAPSWRAVQPAE